MPKMSGGGEMANCHLATNTHLGIFDNLQICLSFRPILPSSIHTSIPAAILPTQILFLFYMRYSEYSPSRLCNLIGRFGRLLILLRGQRPRRSQSGSAEYAKRSHIDKQVAIS